VSKTLSPSPSGESPQAQGPAEQDIKGVLKGTDVAQTRNIYIYIYMYIFYKQQQFCIWLRNTK